MTRDAQQVPAFEHGRLRLYAVDAGAPAGSALIAALRSDPRDAGPVDAALGATRVDPYWIDLVALADIAELGLAGYLREAYDVPEDQLAAAQLDKGATHVLIAPSRAFANTEQTLHPDPALTPLAVFDLARDVGELRPTLASEVAAELGTAAPPARASARPAGPPAMRGLRPAAILILLVIAAAFILLVAR